MYVLSQSADPILSEPFSKHTLYLKIKPEARDIHIYQKMFRLKKLLKTLLTPSLRITKGFLLHKVINMYTEKYLKG